jgi:hypothetical protein
MISNVISALIAQPTSNIANAEVLVVAGGGGGGGRVGGGGGAGGYRSFTGLSFTPASSYTVTIGTGGAEGTTGVNSSIIGGYCNKLYSSVRSSIIGGFKSELTGNSFNSSIIGGYSNLLFGCSYNSSISIFLENELIVPVKAEFFSDSYAKSFGIPIRFQSLEEKIDESIEKYNKNPISIIDQRHTRVKQHLYKNESYNIYRLELSLYLENNNKIKESIINITRNSKINVNDK